MTETSARFALPFILPGQAQKELYHNEALAAIDAALHPAVEDGPLADSARRAGAGPELDRRRRRDRRLGREGRAIWRPGRRRLAVRGAGPGHARLEH